MIEFEFKKSLGQNFLQDKNVISKITSKDNFLDNSLIIEIGPGSGALTKELVKTGNRVICFEIDKRLDKFLSEIEGNITIIYEDFLKVDLKKVLKNEKFENLYIVSNLPYYITTPIITQVVEEKIPVNTMFLMMQKEVALRIKAKPNTRDYNSLSIYLQYNFKISTLVNVSKNSFIPKPKVDSIVLRFDRIDYPNKPRNEKIFYDLIKDAFNYKRKNLKNNLKAYDLDKIEEVLKSHNKDLTFRAEQITIDEFIEISNNINKHLDK